MINLVHDILTDALCAGHDRRFDEAELTGFINWQKVGEIIIVSDLYIKTLISSTAEPFVIRFTVRQTKSP